MSGEFLGVDVGGTKMASAVLRDGELAEHSVQPTDSGTSEALIDEIAASIEAIRTPDTRAVGVGVPSVMDWRRGVARTSVNVPLTGVPLRDILRERAGLPVFVDNDATLAGLAEAYEGERLVSRHLVMLTVGTGVGGGVIIDGRPYRGATGAAAELGHTLIGMDLSAGVPAGESFPQLGSLESFASGSALGNIARQAAADHPDSFLGRRAAAGDEVTGVDAVEGAEAGDAVATRAVELLGERLGVGIANAINTFDPEVVAIGGGVSNAGDLLLEPARRVARRFVLPGVGEATEIRLSVHGPRAGVLGAALLAKLESQPPTGSEGNR